MRSTEEMKRMSLWEVRQTRKGWERFHCAQPEKKVEPLGFDELDAALAKVGHNGGKDVIARREALAAKADNGPIPTIEFGKEYGRSANGPTRLLPK